VALEQGETHTMSPRKICTLFLPMRTLQGRTMIPVLQMEGGKQLAQGLLLYKGLTHSGKRHRQLTPEASEKQSHSFL
jgi:hypothetical protein